MDSTVTERGLGLVTTELAEMVLYGFVIYCLKEYREFGCGPGVTIRGLILEVTEITSL